VPRASWLKTVLRFWGLRRGHAAPDGSPGTVILLLCLLWLVLWVSLDWWVRQPNPKFFADGIPVLAWYGLGVVALAGLLYRRSEPPPPFAATVALVTGLVPLPVLLATFGAG
jgi:hypothetical protein